MMTTIFICILLFCRSLPFAIFCDAGTRGNSIILDRTWHGSANAFGCTWRVEHNSSVARWHRHFVLHRNTVCRHLLQCNNHLVYLLLYKQFSSELNTHLLMLTHADDDDNNNYCCLLTLVSFAVGNMSQNWSQSNVRRRVLDVIGNGILLVS